ncbi:class I SAM-dependent methyltransferase [Donghicola tyrosinivorans]|uniref:Methyltransferase family protein n=1 Tax=Donghicola tyrosinivorans TaxID=1652492 RepID=A0A2T0WWD6_9RHOB|nr:class I SAM-dependent methyltransferase [Donghicola tyrosinivorans]PRY90995.1 methyltransferase family protein [Donghicola tyrosinivorans]
MKRDTSIETEPKRYVRDLYACNKGKISDKWSSYLDFYEEIFAPRRDRPLRILEIGIQNGGSLEIWARYFDKAEQIVGCDIAPAAAKLCFADPRIQVIVGDANQPETFAQIAALSDRFDIIIDDGSHRSGDIVRSFGLYFPLLAEGGLYIAEDLHCSYWQEFEGGLEAPFASMTFFKRLADLVNREHWGASLDADAILGYFAETYGAVFDAGALGRITEVRFRNSICAIVKGAAGGNAIGPRVVAGTETLVEPRVSLALNGTHFARTNQTGNPFGPLAPRLEAQAAFSEQVTELEARVALAEDRTKQAQKALRRARRYPLAGLRDKLVFKMLRALAKASPLLSSRTTARFGRKAAKYNPDRGL